MKSYCTLLNLRSYYEIGNLLGKGNFARVYEATLIRNKDEKFAIKTIEKSVLSKNKRNFVRSNISDSFRMLFSKKSLFLGSSIMKTLLSSMRSMNQRTIFTLCLSTSVEVSFSSESGRKVSTVRTMQRSL